MLLLFLWQPISVQYYNKKITNFKCFKWIQGSQYYNVQYENALGFAY